MITSRGIPGTYSDYQSKTWYLGIKIEFNSSLFLRQKPLSFNQLNTDYCKFSNNFHLKPFKNDKGIVILHELKKSYVVCL